MFSENSIFNFLNNKGQQLWPRRKISRFRSEKLLVSSYFRFRGGIHPDVRMIKKRTGRAESSKKRGDEEEFRYKEERIHEEYDRAIQVDPFFP
jgi:hypothetical protein